VSATITGLMGIIVNIFSNAIEAMRSQTQANKIIDIEVFAYGGYAGLIISDNGPGIDDEIKNRIFDPFFTTKNTQQNMGLGLSIIRSIVHSFNGRLSIVAGKDGGAGVRIELPQFARVAME
jgi:C4-dicarboxylate-specific signal transduction histidine kinase